MEYMMSQSEIKNLDALPTSWIWTTIGEIAKVNQRNQKVRELSDDLAVTFVPMAAVDADLGIISTPQTIALTKVKQGFTSFMEDDVLFAKITPCMENGKAAIARNLQNRVGFGSTEFHVMTPEQGILSEWLFFYVRQESFRTNAKANFSGTAGQLRVKSDFVTNYRIPLAPLAEQQRIVAAIETHFTRLDTAVAGLHRLQANLKRYRAAVLKAACEGRLVDQDPTDEPATQLLARILAERRSKWQAANPGKKYQDATPPDTSGLSELPEGWVWGSVNEISQFMQYGTSDKAEVEWSGAPVMRMGNIQEGKLDFTNLKFMPEGWSNLAAYELTDGDLLFNRTNSAELVGKTAVYKKHHLQAVFASYLIRVRVAVEFLPDFLSFYINSVFGRQYIASVVSQQVGQANVNGTKLANMPVPIPPLAEQTRIVAEVERRLSVIDQHEKAIRANLACAARLRQSILKRAFSGRLVPQDPTDEPASMLLERIHAQRKRIIRNS